MKNVSMYSNECHEMHEDERDVEDIWSVKLQISSIKIIN